MTKLSTAQQRVAHGRIFNAPGVIQGCSDLVFAGIWPSGNVAVKKVGDDDRGMGPLTVSAAQAKPLFAAINRQFNARGTRRFDTAQRAAQAAQGGQ